MQMHIIPSELLFSYGWCEFDPVSSEESFSSLTVYTREARHAIKRFRYQRKGAFKITLFYKSYLSKFSGP